MFKMSVLLLSLAVIVMPALAGGNADQQGVYVYVVKKSDLNFETASQALEEQLASSRFQLLATIDMASYNDCGYRSRVFVVYDSAFATQLLQLNRQTAPFAVTDRINIFEDEDGVHASIVNPLSVMRTVFMDDKTVETLAKTHRQNLQVLISNAIPGETSEAQYGEFRKKGYIGRTMGVMAGGPFNEKIQTVVAVTDGDFAAVIARLNKSLADDSGKWGLRAAYRLDLGPDMAVFGSTSQALESKSFSIVNAGSDKSRKEFTCPGVAHGGAYPLEIAVIKENGTVKVQLVDTMFRMKMFFEDAGMMAFMKNMTMPGSLMDELKGQIETAVK